MKHNNVNKIASLYGVIVFIILIFLFKVLIVIFHKPNGFISTIYSKKDLAIRGPIISKDNYIIAQNNKLYNVAIIGKYINPTKKELLIKLLSIYTNKPISYFKKKLNTNSRIIILKNINYHMRNDLKYLSNILFIKKVFLKNQNNTIYGLDIFEVPSKRKYIFNDSLEPILGYVRTNKNNIPYGQVGLEKYYDEILRPKQNGILKGQRDVNNYIILDNSSIIKPRIDGDKLKLNINWILQGKIEKILDVSKEKLKAKEILVVIMQSKTGKIISIASSNRYNPNHITQKDLSYLRLSHIQYSYEPGSVMKPITLAILLSLHKTTPIEILNAHNGVWYFKPGFTIYDDERFKWLSVTQAVIHSSNIVFGQLGLRLSPSEFRNGLLKFGFGIKSGIDLPYEYKGVLFPLKGFQSEVHRVSNAFGYAIRVNLIQLLKAYNAFNNQGIIIIPKIGYSYNNTLIQTSQYQVISPSVAQKILNILRKVVLFGTGKNAKINGIFTAGKTGTARISQKGNYIKGLYNSSFIGFANDKTHKYTIAVLVRQPNIKNYFASQSAVLVFRDIVKTMIEMNFLHPKNK